MRDVRKVTVAVRDVRKVTVTVRDVRKVTVAVKDVRKVTVAVKKQKALLLNISVCACVVVGTRSRECDFARVVLLIQHAKLMRHIVICGLSGSTTFFDII
jgi:hypothetical protein